VEDTSRLQVFAFLGKVSALKLVTPVVDIQLRPPWGLKKHGRMYDFKQKNKKKKKKKKSHTMITMLFSSRKDSVLLVKLYLSSYDSIKSYSKVIINLF